MFCSSDFSEAESSDWSMKLANCDLISHCIVTTNHTQEMKFGWKIIVGTLIGILGGAFGSVGGVGGGGFFVPMLILIIGFDAKSATAISKCKIFLNII